MLKGLPGSQDEDQEETLQPAATAQLPPPPLRKKGKGPPDPEGHRGVGAAHLDDLPPHAFPLPRTHLTS